MQLCKDIRKRIHKAVLPSLDEAWILDMELDLLVDKAVDSSRHGSCNTFVVDMMAFRKLFWFLKVLFFTRNLDTSECFAIRLTTKM
jgi:hypothetical protein